MGVHEEVSAKIVEHDGVGRVVELGETIPNDLQGLGVADAVLGTVHCDHGTIVYH